VNAVWTYEQPFEAVALIAGYIAFYPDRVDEIGESPTVWLASQRSVCQLAASNEE
jgi:hypothetical protein